MSEHVVGAKPLPLPDDVTASAVYGGPSDCYRYLLHWVWDPLLPCLTALLMNPSVASHLCGDRTVIKLYRLAKRWNMGRLCVCNVHAYRTTDQMRLAAVDDPVGPFNSRYVFEAAQHSDLVLVGYGTPKVPSLRENGLRLCRTLHEAGIEMVALKTSADGTPWHPLYIAENKNPERWIPR